MLTELSKERIELEIEYCDTRIDTKRAEIEGIKAEIRFEHGQKMAYNNVLKVIKGD